MSESLGESIDARGPSLRTFTKRLFYPSTPRPEEIHIVDVAHALATIQRFCGTLDLAYNVAPHCVHTARLVGPPAKRPWTLMHEVAEALSGFGDVIGQIKRIPEVYAVIKPRERLIDDAASVRFGLPIGFAEDPDVKLADNLAYRCENRDFRGLEEHPTIVGMKKLEVRSDLCNEWEFLRAFEELFPNDSEIHEVQARLHALYDKASVEEWDFLRSNNEPWTDR